MKPSAKSIGARRTIAPPIIVPIRSRYSIPAGTARRLEVSE